jgi:hypothetical protein
MIHRRLSFCLILVACGCGAPSIGEQEPFEETGEAVTGGTTYNLKLPKMSGDTGNCADVAGASTSNGAQIDEWDCNGSNAQKFQAVDLGGGYYQLKNTNSGLCIDIYGGSTAPTGNANGTKIQQYTCKTSNYDNQAWKFVSYNGYYQIQSKCGPNSTQCYGDGVQRCLDVTGGDTMTANGTKIELWQCGSSTSTKGNQTFNPVAVSSGGGGGSTGNFPARFAAPYVATWTNTDLVNLSNNTGNKFWTLAFVIPPSGGGCSPTWNGDTSLTGNNYGTYITNLRGIGGDVEISFGGAEGGELGKSCGDVSTLQAAYEKVITQFNLKWMDLDIESGLENDSASIDRRNKALHNLEALHSSLRVSYTLAVDRTGLGSAQLNLLKNAKANGVRVDVVNIMAMDYGPCYTDMGKAAVDAASATKNQLANIGLSAKVGVTPMIKTNDTTCEVFSPTDASVLVNYAQSNSYIMTLGYWKENCDSSTDRSCDLNSVKYSANTFINIFKTFH